MRSIQALAVAALVAAAAFAPAAPSGAHGNEEYQTQPGGVLLPTRFTDGTSAFPGVGRRLSNIDTTDTQGIVAWVFNIDQETLGGRFQLELDGDLTGEADLGVFFYTDMADATLGLATTTAEYDATGPGGEEGAIPSEALKAIVFMKTGLNAEFVYRGYSPVVNNITSVGYEHPSLSVLAGQSVIWTNPDAAFHGVTSVERDGAGAPLYDSSPGLHQPIVQGASFSYTFFEAGTYHYFDKYTGASGEVAVTGVFGEPAG